MFDNVLMYLISVFFIFFLQVESLYEQTGFIPCQAALAGLLCEVCLHAVQKTKDEKITCGLQLQLASMIKDIILDRVSWNEKDTFYLCSCVFLIMNSCHLFGII